MIDQATTEVLELFQDRLDHLLSLSMITQAKKVGATLDWKKDLGWNNSYVGPEGEPLQAFALNLRFFIQDNEPTSLRNMAQVYAKLPLGYSERFKELRDAWNQHRSEPTPISIKEGEQLTHGEIFDISMYGNLAHSNSSKRKLYKDFRDGAWFEIFQAIFGQTLQSFIVLAEALRDLNGEVLKNEGCCT